MLLLQSFKGIISVVQICDGEGNNSKLAVQGHRNRSDGKNRFSTSILHCVKGYLVTNKQ